MDMGNCPGASGYMSIRLGHETRPMACGMALGVEAVVFHQDMSRQVAHRGISRYQIITATS
jgi:hypothetical protein